MAGRKLTVRVSSPLSKPMTRALRVRDRETFAEEEHVTLPVEVASVRSLREMILRVCGDVCGDHRAVEDFALAVSEAATNAIRHGTAKSHDSLTASIRATPKAGSVRLDYPGDPFPAEPPRLPGDECTNGRGRYLMYRLADRVEYAFEHGRTRVELRKRWHRPASEQD